MDDQYIWTGADDGQSWNDRKNWYDKTKAQLPAAVSPGLTSNVTIANADITDTGSADILNVSGPLTLDGTLTVNQFTDTGGTTVDAGAKLVVNSTSLGATEAANLTLVGGTVALTVLTVAATGTLTLTNASTLTARGGTNPTPANGTLGLDLEGTGTIDASTLDSHAAAVEIGQHNNASLTISDGSTVKSASTFLGNAADGSGNLLVTDAGTTWTDGALQVGGAGSGALSLAAGATLNETGTLVLGVAANSSGNMTMTDAGTTATVASSLIVGKGGSGGLAVQSGAALTVGTQLNATGEAVELGALAGSNGSLDINDATLSANTGEFDIGFDGTGAVSMEAGSQATTGDASGATARGIDIGVAADGSGAMSVDGSGTTLTNTGRFVVGDAGNGAFTVSNGAVVSTTIGAFGLDGVSVGHAATGVGAVDVNGAGATLTIATDLVVGDAGQGGLTVENGATLDVATGSNIVSGSAIALGVQATGNGAMTVTGVGSDLNAATGQLALGIAGQAAMSIANGATAATGDASGATANGIEIGQTATGGGALSVDGAGTMLTNTGRFVVGDAGSGAFTVSGGAVVATSVAAGLGVDGAVLGAANGSVGNVDVTGTGSDWQVATDLVVGAAGVSGVTVEAGATLDLGAALATPGPVLVLGQAVSGQGTLDVHGKGTTLLANRGTLVVGQAGTGTASFSLGAQAAIGDASGASANGLEMAEDAQSTAALSVDGAKTKLTTSGALTIGDAGAATLAVTNGATVASLGSDPFGNAVLGVQATGTATADINAGTWRVGQNLTVGEDGTATLTIEQGGTVAVGGTTITLGAAADGTGTLALSQATTALGFTGTLIVGDAGTGTFNLSQGATFAGAADIVLGRQAGAQGSVTIQDAGSGLTTNALTLGGAGEGDLQVFNGDIVTVQGNLDAAAAVGGTGTADIKGQGSLLSVSGTSVIGDGGTYTATVEGGAKASFAGGLTLGQQATGNGTLTVGPGSQVSAATLSVGGAGTGNLDVESGATLTVSGASIDIGSQAGGNGTLTIDAATLAFAGALTVGDGGDGTFALADGAQYKTAGGLVVGNLADSVGQIDLDAAAVLTVQGDMTLGLQGEGDLTQTNGAHLAVAGNLVEASGAAATGTSALGVTTIGGNWTLGLAGAHSDTIIGSTVSVGGALTIGAAAGANGALTLGSGANLSVGGAITVGNGGTGALTIQTGTVFDAHLDAVTLGGLSGGSGTLTLANGGDLKAATLTMGTGLTSVGAGSALQVGGAVVVGAIPGGVAELDDSGTLSAASLTVGALGAGTVRIASLGNTITGGVSVGDGSGAVGTLDVTGVFTLGGQLTVGNAGTGMLDVHGNRLLQVGATSVGVAAGSAGEVDVDGSGTVLQATGLTLGGSGAATLDITNNGQLAVSGSATFGAQSSAAAVSATLDSLGSLTVGQNLILGSSGTANLRIQNGGQASVTGTLTLGANALSSGTMTVTGSNTDPTGTITTFSQLGVGTLIVGQAGSGALTVSQSAIVKSAGPVEIAVGQNETSNLTVDGAGSSLQSGALYVGGSNLVAGGSGTLAIQNGATANVAAAHVWSSGIVTLAGGTLQSGAFAIDAGGSLSGYGTLSAPVSNNGSILASGGVLDLAGSVSGAGTLKIAANATLELGGPIAGNGVQFNGAGETLRIDDLAHGVSTSGVTTQQQDFNALISGLAPGDKIAIYRSGLGVLQTIDGYHLVAGSTPGTTSLVLTQGTTTVASLTLAGDYTGDSFKLSSDPSNATLIDLTETACYAQGTHIRTPSGDVTVETLRAGDLVVTADGLARPILWLGMRTIDCMRHPKPHLACPIVVSKDAFGPGLPVRDLALSWGHSLYIDDVLVPVENLINGATVRQVPAERITYWHIELNSHDLVYAEGLLSETYLDTGNRTVFSNGGAFCQLHPDFSRPANAPTCRPLQTEGAAVMKARRNLLVQAEALGFTRIVDAEAGLHLVADGVIIEPQSTHNDRVAFVVPVATRDLRLVSSTFVPAHVDPGVNDMRRLGVCLRRLLIGDAAGLRQTRIALDHPALETGLYAVETQGAMMWRWTNGSAQLNPELWADCDGEDFHLRLIVDGGGSRGRWLAPDMFDDTDAVRACA